MIGRKTVVGLSLFCALMFSALMVESASATETAKNTTAFTCVSKASGGFADAHCDETASPGTFGHEVIALNTETEIEITNKETKNKTFERTPLTLTGILGGVEFSIECGSVENDPSSKSFIKNIEKEANVHDVEGTMALTLSECPVKKPANCTIKSITFAALYKGVEAVGATKGMGLELTQDKDAEGKTIPFAKFTLEGASCALKAASIELFGSMVATGAPKNESAVKQSGATLIFSSAEEMQKLTVGGKTATLSATFTLRMKEASGNPISLTTPVCI